jgi:triosephosphate isomerase
MRRLLVAGNWKMNLKLAQARDLVGGLREYLDKLQPPPANIDIAICPPAVYLMPMAKATDGSVIQRGCQDLYYESSGAFTGEISADMMADAGVKFAIVGHSERRHTIGHLEDDHMINLKVRAAVAAGLVPILCVGETLAEREAEQTMDVLTFQITADLVNVNVSSSESLVIAYEPVWAIGTGKTATPEQAQEAHAHIRSELRRLLGDVADELRILYGGSVKPDNAGEIFSQPDVDGGLIGGASLKADSFLGIVNAALAVGG